MLHKILELENIRAQKQRLEQEEKELAKPMLTDYDLIPVIYDWIDELSDNDSPEMQNYDRRSYFIFIICTLICPRILVSDFFERGKREPIAKFLCVSLSQVTNSFKTVYGWYLLYKDFQNHMDYLYGEIEKRLVDYNIIVNESDNVSLN